MLGASTIRTATEDDIADVVDLLVEAGREVDRALLVPDGSRHIVVLDAPGGGLAAAAVLVIEGRRGHLALLAIAQQFEGLGIEDRVIAVVEALCSAYGAGTLDVQGGSAP